jgi:hypothetical protein
MRRSLLLVPLLVGMLALTGVSAVSAQAELPEFGQCVKASPKKSGKYSDKNCQTEVGAGGKFNWGPINPIDPIGFNDEDRGATFRYFGFIVICPKSESTTFVLGPRDVVTKIVYVDCTLHRLFFCSSPEAAAGTIETSSLTGTLGYIARETHEVGVDYTGEEGVIARFQCGSEPPVTLKGSVIAKVTGDVNKMSAKSDATFEEKGGTQVPDELEGGVPDTPIAEIGGEEGPATITAVEKESGKEKIEIKG